MKSIKEKQILVKWAKAMNEPIDLALVEEVERYEQLQKDILESVRSNSIRDLAEASVIAEKFVEQINIEYPKPPTLNEVLNVLKEEQNELVQALPSEESTQTQKSSESPDTIQSKSLADLAAEHITKEVKLEEKTDSFQQPEPTLVNKNLTDITKKLRFLEQAIGKIAAHGPAGGDGNPFDKVEFMERGVRFTPTPRMMYWNNTEDCVNITQADGSTLQVGLENYIRVFNNTANTFTNGTFIEFTGVDAEGDSPTFRSFINNANAQPLYSIGVLTNDVASNTHGRATVLGLVRDIDTTGSAVGETWSIGDVLWANPTYPGKFTKVKPTSPNVAISVAAVVSSGVNSGSILVRPAIWPRLYYGSFVSTQPQAAANTTSAFAITFNRTEFASGFVIEDNTKIKALNSGLYSIQFSIQFTSTNASTKQIYIFPKKNGSNIPDSSTVYSITGNNINLVPYLNYMISLDADDYVEIYFGVSDTAAVITSPSVPAYSPNIPPVILTITQAAL
jgi:hypothetical protein